jgi:hypothetical protein
VSRRLAILALVLLCGCQHKDRQAYRRNPLVRELNVAPGPAAAPETATQAEPYPPPRPHLPADPSSFASVPHVQSPERTPVP